MLKTAKQAIVGLVLAAATGDAMASANAAIKSMTYDTHAIYGFDVINVYSSDGQAWDTLAGPPVKFTAAMVVETRWPGYVQHMAVLNGQCFDAGCANNPVIDSSAILARNMHWNAVYEIAMDDIPVTHDGGIATIPLGNEILSECNDHLTANGATSLHTFNREVPTSFTVDTRVAWTIPDASGWGIDEPYDETRQDTVAVQVRCNPYVQEVDFIPPAVEEVELFLATFSNAVTHPDAFRECKKGRILVRVTTNGAGPVAFRLWTDTDGVIENELIETWSSDVGSGVYEAEAERWVSVSETSQLHAMAHIENGGLVGLSSGWKSLQLACVTGSDDLTAGESPIDAPGRGGNDGLISP